MLPVGLPNKFQHAFVVGLCTVAVWQPALCLQIDTAQRKAESITQTNPR